MIRWSANLAYVVGLIASDGCLSSDGRHIEFSSKDYSQVQTFTKILNLSNRICTKSSGFSDKRYFRMQFGNVKFYRFLVKIGLTPNKSKTIGKLNIPDKYFIDFLRGHFDGDGCTYSYWDKRWKSSFMFYTSIASGSERFLEWMENKVKNLYGISGKITYNDNTFYQLRYAKNDSILLFKRIYYNNTIPYLERKRFKIEEALVIIHKQASRDGGMADAAD